MTAALPEDTQAEYKRNIPAGRFATTDEVAGVVDVDRVGRRRLHLRRGHPGRRRPRDGALTAGRSATAGLSASTAARISAASSSGCENCGQWPEFSSTISRSSSAASSAAQSGAARDDAADLARRHGAGEHRHGHPPAPFVAQARADRSEPAPAPTRCAPRPGARVAASRSATSGSFEEVPAGERDDAVDDRELPDRAAVAGRERVDEHDAGDALGAGIGGAVDDVAAAAVADEHDQARRVASISSTTASTQSAMPISADSAAGAPTPGIVSAMDRMPGPLERGCHVVPRGRVEPETGNEDDVHTRDATDRSPTPARAASRSGQQRDHFAQVDALDDEVGLSPHGRLRVEREPEARRGHHPQVVRAVADRDRARRAGRRASAAHSRSAAALASASTIAPSTAPVSAPS